MTLPNAKKRKIFDGRYEIIALVGRGSESVVYHARHINSATHEVALKVLHSQNQNNRTSLTDRLRKEALTLVSCRHKYVVRLDDFHSVQDLCYLSMEYAQYGDLRKYLAALGMSLSAEQGKLFLRQMLEALDFVHATGVIHRDVKPDNILVVNEREVRLADFGLSLLPGDEIDLEELKRGAGSFAYLPPELLEGIRYDARSDLYAIGLCFYEALAGFHPFEKLPLAEQLDARRDDRLPPLHEINPTVPQGVSNAIAKLMRFDPERRFQTAAQALRALSDPNFQDTEPTPVNTTTAAAAPPENTPDTFEIIPNPRAANEDTMEVSAQTLVSDALLDEQAEGQEEGSNDSTRERQHTEEFDLERLQSLIEQDTANKTFAAERRSQLTEQAASSSGHDLLSAEVSDPSVQHFPLPGTLSSKPKAQRASSTGPLGLAPIMVKMVIFAALGTVLSLATYSKFVGQDAADPEPQPAVVQERPAIQENRPSEENATASTPAKPTEAFPHLAQGLYAGAISDLLPGTTSPLAFISMPSRKSVVVIIGVPGWAPVEVSLPETNTSKPNTITVRSNGLILNVTGELAGDSITGMFSNAITGESGSWSARAVK